MNNYQDILDKMKSTPEFEEKYNIGLEKWEAAYQASAKGSVCRSLLPNEMETFAQHTTTLAVGAEEQ